MTDRAHRRYRTDDDHASDKYLQEFETLEDSGLLDSRNPNVQSELIPDQRWTAQMDGHTIYLVSDRDHSMTTIEYPDIVRFFSTMSESSIAAIKSLLEQRREIRIDVARDAVMLMLDEGRSPVRDDLMSAVRDGPPKPPTWVRHVEAVEYAAQELMRTDAPSAAQTLETIDGN